MANYVPFKTFSDLEVGLLITGWYVFTKKPMGFFRVSVEAMKDTGFEYLPELLKCRLSLEDITIDEVVAYLKNS